MKVTILKDRDIAKTAAGPVVSCKKGDELIGISDSQAEYLHGKGIVKMDGHRAVKAKGKPADNGGDELDGMLKADLVARAEQLGLDPGKMNKADLSDAIRAKMAEVPDDGDENGEDADSGLAGED